MLSGRPEHGRHPTLNNLLGRVYQVALIDHLQQQISNDLDFRTITSPEEKLSMSCSW